MVLFQNMQFTDMQDNMIHFDSDYMEGALPQVMQRLLDTNLEQTSGYGTDAYTKEAAQTVRLACQAPDALVQFVWGGTQANAVVIDALLRGYQGVLASDAAHISVHESGAIEHSGHKVLTLPAKDGKITAEQVDNYVTNFYADETYEHMVAPGMVYITQPTELGTLYTLDELEAMSAVCRAHRIPLYIDGARMAYGLASPQADFTLADLARLADVFYIGGTKCGLLFGEAIVAPNPATLPHFFPYVKQHGAHMAKGRLAAVQFLAVMEGALYIQAARRAVAQALCIRSAFEAKGYRVAIESPTNQQFFVLPNAVLDRLLQVATFEVWGSRGKQETTVRFVTGWATKDEDVDRLIAAL